MKTNYKKFYDIKRFTKAAVDAHKEGKPLNPAGCSGNPFLFTYQETDANYKGKLGIHGTFVQASGLQMYCASINKVLDNGGEVVSNRAYHLGVMLKCPVISLADSIIPIQFLSLSNNGLAESSM